MEHNYDDYLFDESLGRYPYSFTLGLKEVLFLGLILFFGFCGFSVCVDKIYASDSGKSIDDVTIHEIELKTSEPLSRADIHDGLQNSFSIR